MQAIGLSEFAGFMAEFETLRGFDAVEVYFRERLRAAGVPTLYVGNEKDGSPVFAQWVVTSDDQDLFHAHFPGRFPILNQGEILLDGGYTFLAFRHKGIMSEGLRQVLTITRNAGATRAYTYVGIENRASLRACAKVGFLPHQICVYTRRLGREHTLPQPIDCYWKNRWVAAVSS